MGSGQATCRELKRLLSLSIMRAMNQGELRRTVNAYGVGADVYTRNGEASSRDWFNEPRARFIEHLRPDALVLDLGCGPGLEMGDLLQAGCRPVGLDPTPQFAAIAQQRLPTCPVLLGTATTLPFRDGSLDGVWASASLLHVARAAVAGALAEIRRTMRSNAPFYSSVQRGDREGRVPGNALGEHLVWYTYFEPGEWFGLIREAGFQVRWQLVTEDLLNVNEGATGWINVVATAV